MPHDNPDTLNAGRKPIFRAWAAPMLVAAALVMALVWLVHGQVVPPFLYGG